MMTCNKCGTNIDGQQPITFGCYLRDNDVIMNHPAGDVKWCQMCYNKNITTINNLMLEPTLIWIKAITHNKVLFSNGDILSFYHEKLERECNYAYFDALKPLFDGGMTFTTPLSFELVRLKHFSRNIDGFLVGNPGNMHYVPCYSIQNYVNTEPKNNDLLAEYTTNLHIQYNNQEILSFDCNLHPDVHKPL